jgi:hypothetical protein
MTDCLVPVPTLESLHDFHCSNRSWWSPGSCWKACTSQRRTWLSTSGGLSPLHCYANGTDHSILNSSHPIQNRSRSSLVWLLSAYLVGNSTTSLDDRFSGVERSAEGKGNDSTTAMNTTPETKKAGQGNPFVLVDALAESRGEEQTLCITDAGRASEILRGARETK